MVPMTSAVASSSTLWAQASKEWVIPAKPKPGRKPKKDPPPPPADDGPEPDSKGRRVQNRAAQRAFRERKQSQLADLQARVQSYEQGEMERNVALQSIAKRLKEENELLRKENASLKEELRKLRPEKSPETERKRWREDSAAPYSSKDNTTRKRIKTDGLSALSPESIPSSAISLLPSPCSIVSSPESDSGTSSVPNDSYSPLSFANRSPLYSQQPSQQPAMASLFSGFAGKFPGCVNESRGLNSFDQAFDMVDCGFCSDDTPCVCRELALQQVAARIAVHGEVPGSGPSIPTNTTSTAQMGSHSPPSEVKMESRGSISISSTPQIPPAPVPGPSLPSNDGSSILDNLPAYAPPVALPRRPPSKQGSHPPIFSVFPAQSLPPRLLRPAQPGSADCTGDPSNCLACADDPFGKAFCAALGNSLKECAGFPDNSAPVAVGFVGRDGCGNPSICGTNLDHGSPSSGATSSASISSASSPGHLSRETMPSNAAWAQLKSHPNIAFADLTLLAEVVARRSKCPGPRVVLSSDSQLEALGRRQSDGRLGDRGSDDMPILLTDPHAQYHEGTQARGQLSPASMSASADVVVQCGRQRVVEVEVDGVRDALAMLDGQFQRS